MFLRNIRLTNVRQFENDTFEFGPGFNLLVGENGAGKTTLLRAIVTVLGSSGLASRRLSLVDDDIRLRTSRCEIVAAISDSATAANLRFVFSKQWGERSRRHPRQDRPAVLVYGSNEATCSDFASRSIRRYSQDSALRDASDEAWLHKAAEKETALLSPAPRLSHLQFQLSGMEEGLHQRRSEVNIADGGDHGVVEMVDVVGYEVGQGRVLGVAPEGLDRIQVGRVSGQPFDVEPGGTALVQSANRRPMDVEPIHHHDQRPPMQTVQPS